MLDETMRQPGDLQQFVRHMRAANQLHSERSLWHRIFHRRVRRTSLCAQCFAEVQRLAEEASRG